MPASQSSSRAGFAVRAAAAAVDSIVAIALTFLLSSSAGMFFARRAVVTLRIGEPGTFWKGPLPFILGIVGEFVYLIPFAMLLVWVLDPLTSATIGKRLLRLRVRSIDGAAVSIGRRWARTAILSAGFWGWTLALLAGRWEIAAVATAAGAIVVVGTLAAIGPSSLALHDRLCGTSVLRRMSFRA